MNCKYNFIFSKIKKRKSVGLDNVKKFNKPEIFSLFNEMIRKTEIKYKIKITNDEYIRLIDIYCEDKGFNKLCEEYFRGRITKPGLGKINYYEDFSVDNCSLIIPKLKEEYQYKKTLQSEMNKINTFMKKPLGLDFLLKFDNPEKIRFLLNTIKTKNKYRTYDFSVEQKKSFINKFYYDKYFNQLYNTYVKTNNKFIRPSLDHKISIKNGGTHDLDNLHFISYIENMAKNTMNWDEWLKVRKNINKYFKTE